MKKETKDQIAQAVSHFLGEHKMSANELAKKTGVNAAYISLIRSNRYITNVGGKDVEIAPKYFEKLAEFIGLTLEKSYWETVATSQFKRIIATLEDAKHFGYTNVIIGPTGSGKTFTIRQFAKTAPNDTFVITVGSSDNIGDLIDKVIEAMSIVPAKTKSKKIREIINGFKELRHQGYKPMIIFDEAEYMKMPALCAMKELYDNLNGIASIIMVGTDQLTRNLDKLRKKNKEGIPQLYRRIKFGIRMLQPVDRSFKQFLNGLEPGLCRFLKDNCENYGELHDVLVPAKREAERTGNPLNEGFVRTMLNMPKY